MVPVIAQWRRTGNKSLSEPMLTQFTDAYMRQWGVCVWVCWAWGGGGVGVGCAVAVAVAVAVGDGGGGEDELI